MKRPSTASAKLSQDRVRRRVDTLRPRRDRRGSTLMIVVVLLALLSVLGVLFYSFANQERSNAEYYADGAKVVEAPGLTADTLFDHALEQLIVGPDPRFKNSVLWGKRHSLLANTQGLRDQSIADLTSYDGQGVLLAQSGGAPFVDQDLDGTADSGNVLDRQGNVVQTSENGSNVQDLLGTNDSPAANNLFERETYKLPQPDVGYTYPDQNNAFLAYIGWIRDRNTALGTPRPVIIPSFHRPALYRDSMGEPIPLWEDLNYDGDVTDTILTVMEDRNGNTTADLGSTAANQQFRAHPGHVYVPPGQRGNTTVSRYISTPLQAATELGDAKRVFPFLPMYDGYNPVDNGSGGLDFTGRPADWIGHQGVWGGLHPDPMFNDAYQYDVDNDGDGIREGVWLDLDFPVQELSDGTLYIPMFSMTVLDLDGLINLNAHGNIQNLLFPLDGGGAQAVAFNNNSNQFGFNVVTGQVEFLSQSNLGLHAAEVNPAWALTGRAGLDNSTASSTVFDQYRQFYGQLPFDAATLTGSDPFRRLAFRETANMDLAYLKFGRPEVTGSVVDDLHPGLYGEEHLISRNFAPGANNALVYPHPGQSASDDNGDLNENMEYSPQSSGTPANWLDVDQPRDTIGIGSIFATTGVKALDLTDPAPAGPGNRVRWLRYTGYSTNNGVFWGNTGLQTGGLMQSNQAYGLYDDPSEVALYAEDRRDVDDPLEPADSAFLQLDNDDINNLGITSRLEDLASFNFSTTANTNSRGEAIRKRFTTESNDRKSYSLPQSIGRPWEWNDDQGFAADTSNDKLRFPPVFGPSGSVVPRYDAKDPFRSPVRYLLHATREDLQVKQFQQRLAVNQVLVFDWNNPNSTELVYRDMTLHPLDPGNAAIPTTQPQYRGSYPWPNAMDQEYWARRDRQLLARDIYVLLYLLGAGQNGDAMNNPLVTAGTTFYTPQQLQQMAQFAVNLVDAQDKDRVITRFEYDTDLSNGWNLDDNPYTPNTAASEPDTLAGTDRAEVWGVERQELAINEYLAFETTAETADITPQTEHDDSDERQFLCLELRNLAPYEIRFDDTAAWQLVVRQFEPGDMTYDATMERQLTLKAGAGTVVPGGFYTIFSTDRNDPVNPYNMTMNPSPSAFRVDPDDTGTVEWIMPRDTAFNTPVSATGNHLDVVGAIAGNGTSYVEITDGSGSDLLSPTTGNEGALLTIGAPGNLLLNTALPVNMILRRRAHPTRARPTAMNAAQEEDNPWVEVDRAKIPNLQTFDYPETARPTAGMVLDDLRSWEREEPLFQGSLTTSSPMPPQHSMATIANTFSAGAAAENENAAATLTLYQTHFDREFTSLGDLLHLPVVGPPASDTDSAGAYGLTSYTAAMRLSSAAQFDSPESLGTYYQNFAKSAAGMFMVPDHPTVGTVGTIDIEDNRWHRVLELLEVPTRQHRNLGIGTEFEVTRVPGKINLNTLRHPEVLAALIDNELILDFDPSNNSMNEPKVRNLTDTSDNPDWFEQLQNSRDPQDPFWLTQGQDLRLPGLANSTSTVPTDPKGHPFRSLAFNNANANSIQHTLLRDMPVDNETGGRAQQRQLFEVGTHAEHETNPELINPALRHQVLSKLWNNTTVRSNSFVVFASVKLFRASVDATTGAVRIGGPLKEFATGTEERPELPEYRGVFVVDRSLIEKGVSTGGAGFTNFRPFVTDRRILKEE